MFDIKKLPGNVVELGIVDTDNGGNGIPEDISIVISASFFYNKLSKIIILFWFLVCFVVCGNESDILDFRKQRLYGFF